MEEVIKLIDQKEFNELQKYKSKAQEIYDEMIEIVINEKYPLLFQLYCVPIANTHDKLFKIFLESNFSWSLVDRNIIDVYTIEPNHLNYNKLHGLNDLELYIDLALDCLRRYELPQNFINYYLNFDDYYSKLHIQLIRHGFMSTNKSYFEAFIQYNDIKKLRLEKPKNFTKWNNKPYDNIPEEEQIRILQDMTKLESTDINVLIDYLLTNDIPLYMDLIIELLHKYDDVKIDVKVKIKIMIDNEISVNKDVLLMVLMDNFNNFVIENASYEFVSSLKEENLPFGIPMCKKILSFTEFRDNVITNCLRSFDLDKFFNVFEEDISDDIIRIISTMI